MARVTYHDLSSQPRTVGYTGGRNPKPSYETVCGGDGHTEASWLNCRSAQRDVETGGSDD